MRTFDRRITIIAGLIAVALIGLAVVQIILLGRALRSEEEAFQGNVAVALNRVAQAVSTREIINVLLEADVIEHDSSARWLGRANDSLAGPGRKLILSMDNTTVNRGAHGETLDIVQSDGQTALHRRVLPNGDTVFVETLRIDAVDSLLEPGVRHRQMEWHSGYSYQTFYGDSGTTALFAPDASFGDSARNYLVQFVLTSLETQEIRPLRERVDSMQLDSLIGASLHDEGIEIAYEFAVLDAAADSLAFAAEQADTTALRTSPYRSRLFPQDIMAAPTDVVVNFPSKTPYIWAQMLPMAGPAGLFLVLVVAGFVYAIRMLMHQQRMARRLTDFINNMTHEFKTPIATIRLATEALQRPEVRDDAGRVEQFNSMILEENRRMMHQVDKILQMSILEEKQVELQQVRVDLHELITRAVAAMQLTVGERNGSISTRLEAERAVVAGDPVHLANVLYSLLDNANKYSVDEPEIRISTSTDDGALVLRVSDRGIGIAPEDQKQVFDRYFRVSTGDRHDVKGFGLGLTYVKAIVESHGGTISLASSLGHGTEIVIRLPLRAEDNA